MIRWILHPMARTLLPLWAPPMGVRNKVKHLVILVHTKRFYQFAENQLILQKKVVSKMTSILRKSLKDLSDHLNFFVSCQGRSQLSPAIFRASRNHLVASKHSYMLKSPKSGRHQHSVHPNLTYDLIYRGKM